MNSSINGVEMLREALGALATWRERLTMVYLDVAGCTHECRVASLINDVALLKYSGIPIILACSGTGADSFAQRVWRRGVEARVLTSADAVESTALQCGVAKLFFLCQGDGVFGRNGLVREFTAEEGMRALEEGYLSGTMRSYVKMAVGLCVQGVQRIHFVNIRRDGALLEEFLTNKGRGTMVYGTIPPYKEVRGALPEDAVAVATIIRVSIDPSISEEVVVGHLHDTRVFSVDRNVHAVVVTSWNGDVCKMEYLAHSEEFIASEALDRLVQYVLDEASSRHMRRITLNEHRAPALIGIQPWFLRRGFVRQKSNRRLWELQLP